MKPMLAATVDDLADVKYPVYASPKLDGVRALVKGGRLYSRTLKPVPNKYVNELFARSSFSGFDGELIYGSPTAKDVYRQTVSVTGSDDKAEGRDVKFHVFDRWDVKGPLTARLKNDLDRVDWGQLDGLVRVEQRLVKSAEELLQFETECLDAGYEGLILRSPDGLYKFGRSTVKQQGMMKLKRFVDSEFLLLRVVEEMHNANAAKKNALGRTERSSHQAGLVPTGRAGALEVRDLKSGVEFSIGTGLNDEDRAWFWKHRAALEGKFVGKYKSFLIGVKDKPRFPVYLGPREKWDL